MFSFELGICLDILKLDLIHHGWFLIHSHTRGVTLNDVSLDIYVSITHYLGCHRTLN